MKILLIGNIHGRICSKHALEKNGYTVKLSAIGGYGFKADGTKTYTNMLNTLVSTMTTNEKKNVVKIIVGGSYNDRNSAENDISQGMIDFQSAIANNFENCKNVVICPMGMDMGRSSAGDSYIIDIYQCN